MAKQTQQTHSEAEHQDTAHHDDAAFAPPADSTEGFGDVKNEDIVAKAATIAVVGVGVALISAELIPGMLIGVAAAFLPGFGPKMRPFLKNTVKAGYSAVRKTREMMAEASEQMQDMLAEAKAEDVPPVPPPPAAHSAANGVKPQA